MMGQLCTFKEEGKRDKDLKVRARELIAKTLDEEINGEQQGNEKKLWGAKLTFYKKKVD